MNQPTDEFREMARRLLLHEAKEDQNPAALADGAERACQKIYQQMANLIGPAGVYALITRALHLAKVEFPSLNGVEVESPSQKGGTILKGLHEGVKGRDPAEVSRSLAALLANFILLLSTFIGEDLALREVARTWPDVQVSGTGSASREVKN